MLQSSSIDKLQDENQVLNSKLASYKKSYKNLHDAYNQLVKKNNDLKEYCDSIHASFQRYDAQQKRTDAENAQFRRLICALQLACNAVINTKLLSAPPAPYHHW